MAEQTTTNQATETMPMKLDVSVHAIEPKGNLLAFANVKINDCFVVENFRVLKGENGLFVGMPSRPDSHSQSGYRETARPMNKAFRIQLNEAVLGAYDAEISHLKAVTQGQERPSAKEQLKAATEKAAQANADHPPKEKPAKTAAR